MDMLKHFFRQLTAHPWQTILGLFVTITFAAELTTTPVSIQASDESVLRAGISASATTITLEPINKWVNGAKTAGCLNTSAGFAVLEDVGRNEWISFGTNSCNSTTNVTTLTDVRRGLNPTSVSFTAGTGLAWDAGATFRIVDWPVSYNNAVYKDVVTTMTASGMITSGQTSQAWIDANSVTTTQRDAFSVVNDGNIIYNTTLGRMQYRAGGAWISFGSGASINATTTVVGNVRVATGSELYLLNKSSSPYLALSTQSLILTSSGSTHSGRIALTNQLGFLDTQLGGTGTGGVVSGALVIGRGANVSYALRPSYHSGRALVSNGTQWEAKTILEKVTQKTVYVSGASSTAVGASSTAELAIGTHNYTIPANDLISGVMYEFEGAGDIGWGTDGNLTFRIRVGGTSVGGAPVMTPDTASDKYHVKAQIYGTAAAGGAVSVRANIILMTANGQTSTESSVDVITAGAANAATNGTLVLDFSIQFGTSQAAHTVDMDQARITKYSSTAFTP